MDLAAVTVVAALGCVLVTAVVKLIFKVEDSVAYGVSNVAVIVIVLGALLLGKFTDAPEKLLEAIPAAWLLAQGIWAKIAKPLRNVVNPPVAPS
jgi:hypothetical protein